MPRVPKVRWHDKAAAWRSDVGPVSEKTGRRTPKYFRGIPKNQPARARAELEAYLAARDAMVPTGEALTLDGLRDLYLTHSEATAEPTTYHGHRKALWKFCHYRAGGRSYASILVREFTATHLDRAVREWYAAGLSPTYIVRLCSSVQAMLNWSAEPHPGREPERLIPANPVKGYRPRDPAGRPIVIPDAPERYARGEEVRAFLRFMWKRARGKAELESRFDRLTVLLIHFAAHAGCRPGEICRLKWSEIDWADRIAVQGSGKTVRRTGKSRIIVLTAPLVRMLRAIDALPDHHPEFVFTHRRGTGALRRGECVRSHGAQWDCNALSRKVKDLRREAIAEAAALVAAGIEPGPLGLLQDAGDNRFVMYRLRHSKASDDLMAGGNPTTVAMLLGTSVNMLQKRYGHLLTGHLTKSADELAGLRRERHKASPPAPE